MAVSQKQILIRYSGGGSGVGKMDSVGEGWQEEKKDHDFREFKIFNMNNKITITEKEYWNWRQSFKK